MKISLVGYGSLLNLSSLTDTIKVSSFVPVIVKGYKRIFNVQLSKTDVLNLVKSSKHYFNGLMFKINHEQLKKLIKREKPEYHLEKTIAFPLYGTKKSLPCFIFIDEYLHLDKKKRIPNQDYFLLCREGAYNVSRKFGKQWDETTYLASGKKVSDWLKFNPDYDLINDTNIK
ncbi:MAG TPA: hypothetical protein VJI98_00405 [Candidatus Nanoarchaeia archaeon]|nr:hypothetical protein [Candidatus Nanoarchaeia archaeon]